jgi:hypothetical protein
VTERHFQILNKYQRAEKAYDFVQMAMIDPQNVDEANRILNESVLAPDEEPEAEG